jgi:hypothetical protein
MLYLLILHPKPQTALPEAHSTSFTAHLYHSISLKPYLFSAPPPHLYKPTSRLRSPPSHQRCRPLEHDGLVFFSGEEEGEDAVGDPGADYDTFKEGEREPISLLCFNSWFG